ncbi:MAG: C39 family peptidase [Oscillospiraceae bacterium]|nr:C39 family peptidase [Oscillospiraceae bacterium]
MYIENYDQHNYGSTFCLATCTLVIARYYGYDDLTMQDMIDAGVVRENDGYVLKTSYYFTRSSRKSLNYSKITDEIDDDHPVIIYMGSPYGGHYVVADDYSSASASGITVMDPQDGTHKQLSEAKFSGYDILGYYTTC